MWYKQHPHEEVVIYASSCVWHANQKTEELLQALIDYTKPFKKILLSLSVSNFAVWTVRISACVFAGQKFLIHLDFGRLYSDIFSNNYCVTHSGAHVEKQLWLSVGIFSFNKKPTCSWPMLYWSRITETLSNNYFQIVQKLFIVNNNIEKSLQRLSMHAFMEYLRLSFLSEFHCGNTLPVKTFFLLSIF